MGAFSGLHHPLLPGAFALRIRQLLQLLGAPHASPLQRCFSAFPGSNGQLLEVSIAGQRVQPIIWCMLRQCCSPVALCMQPAEASFTITYKRGMVEGQVGADTLSITDGPIVISNQTFGLATSSTLDFTRAACDGIFVRPLRPSFCVVMKSMSALHVTEALHSFCDILFA